jgi:hypothetical protein
MASTGHPSMASLQSSPFFNLLFGMVFSLGGIKVLHKNRNSEGDLGLSGVVQ